MKKLAEVFWSLITRKLLVTLLGIFIIQEFLHRQVNYLYTFTTPEQVAAFTSLSTCAMWAVVALVMWFCGCNVLDRMSWGNQTSSAVQLIAQSISQRIPRPKDFDDGKV